MSSSEDEADFDTIKQIVDCDFIQDCYKGPKFHNEEDSGNAMERSSWKEPEPKEDGFQKFLARKLANLLDSMIEEYDGAAADREARAAGKLAPPPVYVDRGIRIFSDSKCLTAADILPKPEPPQPKPKPKGLKYNQILKRARATAVTPESVMNREGTEHWTQFKKPKLTVLKQLRRLENGKVECVVIV